MKSNKKVSPPLALLEELGFVESKVKSAYTHRISTDFGWYYVKLDMEKNGKLSSIFGLFDNNELAHRKLPDSVGLSGKCNFHHTDTEFLLGNFEQFVKSISGFAIPKKIANRYTIEGDLSNIKEWRGELYFSPINKSPDLGKIGYVLISLDSNHIVPVTSNDEHHVGFEYLECLQGDLKVPVEKYISICGVGTTYVYSIDELPNTLLAVQKFLRYGGDKNLLISLSSGSSINGIIIDGAYFNRLVLTLGEFVELKGNIKNLDFSSLKRGERYINNYASDLIQSFKRLHIMLRNYYILPSESLESQIIKLAERIKDNVFGSELKTLEGMSKFQDVKFFKLQDAVDIICKPQGIENLIHTALKNPTPLLKSYFGDVSQALKEFNQIASI